MARQGVEVERAPRKVTIHSIDVENCGNNDGVIKVSCSKGTYVRTLIHDMGRELGFGAVMTALQRTKSNGFTLDDCYNLEYLRGVYEQHKDDGEAAEQEMGKLLLPLDRLFSYPKAFLNEYQSKLFKNGTVLNADLIRFEQIYDGVYSLFDHNNRIIALARIERDHSISVLQRFNYGG
jgi:tRNA pseudouridine55 synthase